MDGISSVLSYGTIIFPAEQLTIGITQLGGSITSKSDQEIIGRRNIKIFKKNTTYYAIHKGG